jgi:putative transposase
VRTTDSDHRWPISPNLLPNCGWRMLTRPDEVWDADLTYVRLEEGFCYRSVVLDLFWRRIVGWDLSASLEAQGALTALEQALAKRRPSALGYRPTSEFEELFAAAVFP